MIWLTDYPARTTRNQIRKWRKRTAQRQQRQRAVFFALVHSWTLGLHAPEIT